MKNSPDELKAAGRAFWLKATQENNLDSAHDKERLLMACKCLDECAAIEAQIEADGRFVRNRYNSLIEHPGLKGLRDFRTLFVRIIREMGLDLEPPGESRPPRRY
jgi:hypothetical protein